MDGSKFDRILRKYVADGADTADKVLGAAFIVCSKDGILYQCAAGRTDLAADSAPFTVDTWTWVASMTKIVAMTGVMALVERGTVDLDSDMRVAVPELAALPILKGFDPDSGAPLVEANTRPITMRHLLTHGAGLGTDQADPDLIRWSHAVGRTARCTDYTVDGWSVPLRFPPGEGWYYGGATEFAGLAVERLTHQSLAECLAHTVLRPLGMADTTFYRDEMGQKPGAVCVERDPQTKTLAVVPMPVPAQPPLLSLGSGLYMTAADHAKVLRSLLQSSAGEGGLLKKETVDEMFRPQLKESQRAVLQAVTDAHHDSMVPELSKGMPLDHGIGGVINLEDEPGKRRAGSMGWQGMTSGRWWVDRKSGIAGTLLLNVMPVSDTVAVKLFNELEKAVYDLLPGR